MSPIQTNFQSMMVLDLQNLYQAESEQAGQLPKLMQFATSDSLRDALQEHAEETEQQITRLQQILSMLGEAPGGQGEVPAAVAGLVSDAQKVLGSIDEPELRDLALIACAQKTEHYEIACYGTARAMARSAGMDDAARLLQETLNEEEATDKRLTEIALPLLKVVAPEEVIPA